MLNSSLTRNNTLIKDFLNSKDRYLEVFYSSLTKIKINNSIDNSNSSIINDYIASRNNYFLLDFIIIIIKILIDLNSIITN